MDIAPDWILCSHTHCFEYKREHFERALEWTEAVARQMEDVSPDGNLDRHHNPHFTSLFPYIQAGTSGEGLMIRAILQNPYAQAREVSIALVCPEDWDADPVQESLLLPAEGHEDVEFWIRPAASAVGRYMLTVDVVYHGEYLGEKAECYVDLNGGGEG
jgi:hypothetical protein